MSSKQGSENPTMFREVPGFPMCRGPPSVEFTRVNGTKIGIQLEHYHKTLHQTNDGFNTWKHSAFRPDGSIIRIKDDNTVYLYYAVDEIPDEVPRY